MPVLVPAHLVTFYLFIYLLLLEALNTLVSELTSDFQLKVALAIPQVKIVGHHSSLGKNFTIQLLKLAKVTGY